jgi:single-strand DNA-binding protein
VRYAINTSEREVRLNFDQWVDQNGQKRSKHSVVIEAMQMLDSKGDNSAPTRDNTTQDMRENPHPNVNGGRYDDKVQQPSQSMGYDGKPYVAPQPQYEAQGGQKITQQDYERMQKANAQKAMQPHREMPSSNSIPVIDIDEDEIPF